MKGAADDLLKIWYNKAHKMEELHRQASEHYYLNDIRFIIPTIISIGIAGSISFLSLGFKDTEYFAITTGCLNLISSIGLISKEYLGYTNKRFQHTSSSNAYLKIKNLIEIQLNLNKLGMNIPYEKMIPDIGTLINKVDNEAPILPPHMISQIPPLENIIIGKIQIPFNDSDDKDFTTTDKSENKIPIEEYNNNV
jgi:hypothetical protein